jgi:hypothetical protein
MFVWFALHVLFGTVGSTRFGWLTLQVPDLSSFQITAAGPAVAAGIRIFVGGWPLPLVLALCALGSWGISGGSHAWARHPPLSIAVESLMLAPRCGRDNGMARTIDYGNLMHRAMRGLIQTVLEDVAQNGLPGAHHFFITFDTTHPDVAIADWLRARYPAEMTVVIQHWFENLVVTDDGFSITLNFGNQPEPLVIPFDAVRTFVDPSVEFGLRFETHSDDDDEDGEDIDEAEDNPPQHAAEIVSLDKFRK